MSDDYVRIEDRNGDDPRVETSAAMTMVDLMPSPHEARVVSIGVYQSTIKAPDAMVRFEGDVVTLLVSDGDGYQVAWSGSRPPRLKR